MLEERFERWRATADETSNDLQYAEDSKVNNLLRRNIYEVRRIFAISEFFSLVESLERS